MGMPRRGRDYLVGLISDTHGLMRPQALAALAGTDHIIHAGDIGAEEILLALAALAPLTAIRGNNDRSAWARKIPETASVEFGSVRLYVVHDLHDLAFDVGAAGYAAVITGHSHRPAITARDGVLYVNPGSAGPRRFTLPVSVARLRISGSKIDGELVTLEV